MPNTDELLERARAYLMEEGRKATVLAAYDYVVLETDGQLDAAESRRLTHYAREHGLPRSQRWDGRKIYTAASLFESKYEGYSPATGKPLTPDEHALLEELPPLPEDVPALPFLHFAWTTCARYGETFEEAVDTLIGIHAARGKYPLNIRRRVEEWLDLPDDRHGCWARTSREGPARGGGETLVRQARIANAGAVMGQSFEQAMTTYLLASWPGPDLVRTLRWEPGLEYMAASLPDPHRVDRATFTDGFVAAVTHRGDWPRVMDILFPIRRNWPAADHVQLRRLYANK